MKPRLILCAMLLLALAACKRDAAASDTPSTAPATPDPVAQVPAVTAATAEIPVLAMQDVEGKPLEFDAEDRFARIIQHEVDHLLGTLFIDRISTLKRALYKKKLKKILEEDEA